MVESWSTYAYLIPAQQSYNAGFLVEGSQYSWPDLTPSWDDAKLHRASHSDRVIGIGAVQLGAFTVTSYYIITQDIADLYGDLCSVL